MSKNPAATLLLSATTFLLIGLMHSNAWSQCSLNIPNAIGIWRSDGFNFKKFVIPPPTSPYAAAPTNGHTVWQVLPAELCTYFRTGLGANARNRELDFRGVEFNVTYSNGIPIAFNSPNVLITDMLVPILATPTRYAPSPSAVGLTFVGGINAIPGSSINKYWRLSYIKGGAPFVVTPGMAGIAFVWQDYETQFGSGKSLEMATTTNEPALTATDADNSFSGYTPNLGTPKIMANFGLGGSNSGEFCITWFFDQSMIQPIKNATLATLTSIVPGGGLYPRPYSIICDDGRGALFPFTGDVVSYSGNSNRGYPATAAGAPGSNDWLIPFVLFSGDITVVDPLPEIWSTGGNNYIYKEKVSKWIDDLIVAFGGSPGFGGVVSPFGANFGLWLGVDFPAFLDPLVLVNGITFADISAGPQWAGPEACTYDSILNLGGQFCRNLVNMAGSPYALPFLGLGLREHRTLINLPQAGYSPLVTVPGTGMLGFGKVPISLFPNTFSIQCWVYDTGIGKIVDTTNVAITRLQ